MPNFDQIHALAQTASRMESTGEGGRIQVSQATADLLIAAGKSKWITPREDKILAKGKGEMSTWWVAVSSEASTTMSMSESMGSGPSFDQTDLENNFALEMSKRNGEEAPKEQALVSGMLVSHLTDC